MKKGNLIIVSLATILLLGSITTLVIMSHTTSSTDATAIVSLDGKTIKTLPLNPQDDPITFTIEDGKGGYNSIHIEDGKIGIIDTNCPDKLCIKTGFIANSALPIVCLPHALTIQVKDHISSKDLDIIVQ